MGDLPAARREAPAWAGLRRRYGVWVAPLILATSPHPVKLGHAGGLPSDSDNPAHTRCDQEAAAWTMAERHVRVPRMAGRARWIAAAVLGVAFVLWLVLFAPRLLVPAASVRDVTDAAKRHELQDSRLKLQNDVRTTLLQGLGGLAVLVGAFFTYRQVQTSRRQLEHTIESSRQQHELDRQGQVTERFTRAIDQLGHAQLDVRLGGIYALERIARDSPDDRATIGEVLTAFVRGHAPWPPRLPGQYMATAPIDEVPELQIRAPDVQACLTVLGRGGFASPAQGHGDRLNLHAVDLRQAYLRGAHLERARLVGAHLEGANLIGAHLEEADLSGAHLEGADLHSANLDGAILERANLKSANLESAHLTEAKLARADLTRAFLLKAHLERAHIIKANLEGATLSEARLEGANLGGATLENASLGDAHLEGAIIGGVNFEGAFLVGVHVQGARADHLTRWSGESDWRAAGVTFE
jgi:uncharacterized protein YjbI with pentapeptide repeats